MHIILPGLHGAQAEQEFRQLNDLIIIENNVPLADSRKIAEELGIDHRSFFRLILDYQEAVEQECGAVRFKNAPKKNGNKGGDTPRYAMLTEVQTNAYLSLARNTPQAVRLKIKLAKAFDDAKKIIAELLNKQQQQHLINKNFTMRIEANKWLAEKYRFTVEEKTNVIALQGHITGLGFADNAFLDNSLGAGFYPWCEEQGYNMSLVRYTEKPRLVIWYLNANKTGYDFERPIYQKVRSYPMNPFALAWEIYLVEHYWPKKFLPYIKSKYRGEERAINTDAGIKVISFYTGLTPEQITAKYKKKLKGE